MEIKIYKIRENYDNFSSGSTYPRGSKRGKIWNSLGAVKKYLTALGTIKYPKIGYF